MYYIRGNHFCSFKHLVSMYISPRGVVRTLVYPV